MSIIIVGGVWEEPGKKTEGGGATVNCVPHPHQKSYAIAVVRIHTIVVVALFSQPGTLRSAGGQEAEVALAGPFYCTLTSMCC